MTDGDDLDELFLPEELVSDDASGALLSDYKKKVRTDISMSWKPIHAKTENSENSELNSLTCSSYIIKYWEIVALFGKLLLLRPINSQYNYCFFGNIYNVHVEQPKDG